MNEKLIGFKIILLDSYDTPEASQRLGNMLGPSIGWSSGVYIIGPWTTLWILASLKQGMKSMTTSKFGVTLSMSGSNRSFSNAEKETKKTK